MPVFEMPPLETLPLARERWTPLYLEHGRLEVDDSSVKWIGADRTVLRLPAANLSALLLGPGTTVTHAAVKACADSNTPVCWVGQDGMRFYSTGFSCTHDSSNARIHAEHYASSKKRTEIARRLFLHRFPRETVDHHTIPDLRLLEGQRVRALYSEMGARYGIRWMGRNYNPDNWDLADNINRAISAANAAFYGLCTAVITSMGFIPSLGFIHSAGPLAFVYDIADLYKPSTTLEAAFHAVSINSQATEKDVIALMKQKIEGQRLMKVIPQQMQELFT